VENHNCNKFSRCYKEQAWLLKLSGRSPVQAVWQADEEKATGKNMVVVAEGKQIRSFAAPYVVSNSTRDI
jgi:hypothetical protein